MGVMEGVIVQANSLSVSLGQKYSSMKAATRKGMMKTPSQRVSGKMRSSRTIPADVKNPLCLFPSSMLRPPHLGGEVCKKYQLTIASALSFSFAQSLHYWLMNMIGN